jgi:hypothetical protein
MLIESRSDLVQSMLPDFDEVHVVFLCTHHKILRLRAGRKLLGQLSRFLYPKDLKKARRKVLVGVRRWLHYANSANIRRLYEHFHDLLDEQGNVRRLWLVDTSMADSNEILPFQWSHLSAILTGKQEGVR